MPCYMYINGMKQRNGRRPFRPNGGSTTPIQQPPQSTNSNIHKMETARGYFNDFKKSL